MALQTEFDFNTSHVTVYRLWLLKPLNWVIHFNTSHVTVYLFHFSIMAWTLVYFNTSHVTVYRKRGTRPGYANCISIHPMLRFIKANGFSEKQNNPFQYIPCYGLSTSRNGLHWIQCYFNTSHVTVYLNNVSGHILQNLISIHPMLRFIAKVSEDINIDVHFNTSHVTVYRNIDRTAMEWSNISIHPMLRFI